MTWTCFARPGQKACKTKDVEEEMRRWAYDMCPSHAAKEVWASEPQSLAVNHQEIALGQGVVFCNNVKEPYRAIFLFKEYRDECWVCGLNGMMQSAQYGTELDWKKAAPALHQVDLRGGPRTSPHEAEASERNGYW